MAVAELESKLPDLITEAGHSEIWSVPLDTASPVRALVLQKYLKARNGDVAAAAAGILATLKWRKEFEPAKQADATHDASKFGGLGYVTQLDPATVTASNVIRPGGGGRKAIVTWNVYGAVTDHAHTFGDVDEFLRWRVGLMERGVRHLRLTEEGLEPPEDDIAMVQVHDYLNVSFLRQNPATRAATKKTIEVLAAHYPELLSRKYFVNVPVVMGFMFGLIKPFVAAETAAKFQVLSYGSSVAGELGKTVPKVYGGNGPELKEQDLHGKTEGSGPAEMVDEGPAEPKGGSNPDTGEDEAVEVAKTEGGETA